MRQTLRALLELRRLVPVLLMGLALVGAQIHLSRGPASWAVALAMAGATWALAPFAWRALFADGRGGLGRALLFALLAVAVVLGTGPGLSIALGIPGSFLTIPSSLAVCVALFLVGGWGLGRDIGFEEPAGARAGPGRRAGARGRARAAARAARAPRSALPLQHAQRDRRVVPRRTARSPSARCCSSSAMLRDGARRGARADAGRSRASSSWCATLFELHLLRDPDLLHARVGGRRPLPRACRCRRCCCCRSRRTR